MILTNDSDSALAAIEMVFTLVLQKQGGYLNN